MKRKKATVIRIILNENRLPMNIPLFESRPG